MKANRGITMAYANDSLSLVYKKTQPDPVFQEDDEEEETK